MTNSPARGSVSYTVRPSVRNLVKSFALTRSGIVESTAKGKRKIHYRDIAGINLASFGSTGMRCVVRSRSGTKIAIPSREYVSLGNFADREEEFAGFVSALHDYVDLDWDEIEFTRGHAGLYRFMIGFMVLAILMLAAIGVGMFAFDQALDWAVARKMLLVGVFAAGIAYPLAKVCKPGPYDPAELPFGLGEYAELDDEAELQRAV